jgi:chorismate dehydratase
MRVGSVPYVNARPLVWALPDLGVEVLYAIPSELPALLENGEVSAILVSSIEVLRRNDLVQIGDVGIVSQGHVDSVRMFSKVPMDQIESLALDQSSMTSNALALGILRSIGVHPATRVMSPNLEQMLNEFDAGILIGDIGMDQDAGGLYVYDLGEQWTQLTGLPFVWAVWTAKRGVDLGELPNLLNEAYQRSKEPIEMDHVILDAMLRSGWNRQKTEKYLLETMSFEIGVNERNALIEFKKLISLN